MITEQLLNVDAWMRNRLGGQVPRLDPIFGAGRRHRNSSTLRDSSFFDDWLVIARAATATALTWLKIRRESRLDKVSQGNTRIIPCPWQGSTEDQKIGTYLGCAQSGAGHGEIERCDLHPEAHGPTDMLTLAPRSGQNRLD